MRRIIYLFTAITILTLTFSSCSEKEPKDITCEEIIDAYEKAGYTVSHNESEGFEYDCYINVESKDGEDDIYIHRFSAAEEAASRGEEREYHVLIWLFSVIYGDPTWVYTEVYDVYEIEYTNKALYKPFKSLIK